jgi:hypothetical protein
MGTCSYTERILGPGGKILRAKLLKEIDIGQSYLRDSPELQETADFLNSMGNIVDIVLLDIRKRLIRQIDISLETAQEMNNGKGGDIAYLKRRARKFRTWDPASKSVNPEYKTEIEKLQNKIFRFRVECYQEIMKSKEKTYAGLVKDAWPNEKDAKEAFFKEFEYQKQMVDMINSNPEILKDTILGVSGLRKPMQTIINAVYTYALLQLEETLKEVYGASGYTPTLVSNGIKAE